MTQTTIVLGCSRTKRTHVAAVVETLAGRGNAVEVVSGLDDTNEPWRDAIHRLGREAVYILCGDENINLRRTGELRALLGEAGVPSSRVWCGPVDWSKPVELLRHVEQVTNTRNVAKPPAIPTPSGPSETSGTVVPPPSLGAPMPMASASVAAPSASTSGTFASRGRRNPLNWKPLAAAGGVALLAIAAAIPIAMADDGEAADTQDEVAVASVAADPTPAADLAEPSEPDEVAESDEGDDDSVAEATASINQEALSQVTPEERDRVFEALVNQRVRALDILLVAPEARRPTKNGRRTIISRFNFEQAFAHCSELDIDGLSDWRLPSAGELASLSANKMLSKGVYWSETEGDSFGNRRVVWSVHRKRMKPMKRSYRGARTICVRHIAKE